MLTLEINNSLFFWNQIYKGLIELAQIFALLGYKHKINYLSMFELQIGRIFFVKSDTTKL